MTPVLEKTLLDLFWPQNRRLGGGNSNIFNFHPNLGKIPTHFDEHIFQMGWWKTTNQKMIHRIQVGVHHKDLVTWENQPWKIERYCPLVM